MNPELYDPADPAKFRVEHGGLFEDLPRSGRPSDHRRPPQRRDLMISGLQVAFLLFHNRVVDKLRADGEDRALAAALRPAGRATTPEREEDDRRAPSSGRRAAW